MVNALPMVEPSRARILVVDDDPQVLRALGRLLSRFGYEVTTCSDGLSALDTVQASAFDLVITDISMPGMDGIELLRTMRDLGIDLPILLATGAPSVDTAIEGFDHAAFHYFRKPFDTEQLLRVIDKALRSPRRQRSRPELRGTADSELEVTPELVASYTHAMDKMWMAYQPIIWAQSRALFGYEALLRSDQTALPHPGAIIAAAEKLDRLPDLGRRIRAAVGTLPMDPGEGVLLFVNLHPRDLMDDSLYLETSPLSLIAKRVVLEITERASLDEIRDARRRIAELRELGFRIAVDDLGAGYAGLASFASLEPEIVKLDMSLVRGIHESKMKQKLVHSMATVSKEMGMLVVAEGIETAEERDMCLELGCDLFQGFLFAKPGRPFPKFGW